MANPVDKFVLENLKNSIKESARNFKYEESMFNHAKADLDARRIRRDEAKARHAALVAYQKEITGG